MTPRRRILGPLTMAAALLLSGCGDGGGGGQLGGVRPGLQDINPQDPTSLRDGGDLRIPLDNLPENYNPNEFDGTGNMTHQVMMALIPYVFTDAPDGGSLRNADYVTSAEVISTAPEVIRYHINDRAVWSSGRPITWEDFAAQVRALNGTNPAFLIADKTGYQNIDRVERGATDKDVVVTFRSPFAEWQGRLFNPLLPKEVSSDPALFNTGWLTGPTITAGPFQVGQIDQTAKTITLVRNPRWWGDRPRLSRVIFTVTDRNALADRLANNEIDLYEIGSSVDLFRRAQGIPGVRIRQATPKQYGHITFNGAPGAVLSDLALRQAVARGIDREGIARRLIGQIVPNPVPMGNHIYPVGSKDYRDNSGVVTYDAEAANRALDALGWVRPLPGSLRAKNGTVLNLRMVTPAGNPISDAIAKTTLGQLAQIGVGVQIIPVPNPQFFPAYVNVGNFDLTTFQWVQTGSPFSDSNAIYQEPRGADVGQNYGRVYDSRITALFTQGLAELDDAKRADLGNQADRLIWQEVHDLPLYPQTGAFAMHSTVANFGAKGLGDWDFVHAGFTR
jgi:peptide/nickel transport system substrate-binding protein